MVEPLSEQDASQFYQLAHNLMGIADMTGHILHVNPAFEKLSGYQATELYSQSYSIIKHPDETEQLASILERLQQGEHIEEFEARFISKDGTMHWIIWEITPHDDKLFFVGRNITKRKEEQLQADYHRQLYLELIRNLPGVGVLVFDHDLRYHIAEGDVMKVAGFLNNAIVGKTMWEALPPASINILEELYRDVLAGETLHFERFFEERHYAITMLPIKDADGAVNLGVIVVQDVTDERQILTYFEESIERITTFYTLSQNLMGGEDIPALMQAVADSMTESMLIDRALVIWVDTVQEQVLDLKISGEGKSWNQVPTYQELMEGLSGWAIRTGDAVLSTRENPDPRESEFVQSQRRRHEVGDVVVAPIMLSNEEVFGTLTALTLPDAIKHLSDEDVELLTAIANQSALAFENKLRQQKLQATLRRTELLYKISQTLVGKSKTNTLVADVVQSIADNLGIDRVVLITVDIENRQIRDFIAAGEGVRWVYPINFEELWEGLSGWVLRENKPARSSRNTRDPRESPAVQARRQERNTGSIIVVPVCYMEKALGTLTLINDPSQDDFSEADVELVMTIANQIGAALENARLVDVIRQSESLYRQMLENASDIVYRTNRGGYITYVTPVAERLTGYTMDEILTMRAIDFAHPDNREAVAEFYRQQIANREPVTYYEYKLITKQGETRWVGQNVRLLIENNEFIGTQGISRDITERKQIEDEREQLIFELDAFAHTVAHDLKTPLGVVMGYADILLESFGDQEGDAKFLVHVVRAGRQMEHIIDDLLKLAALRKEADIQRDVVDMTAIIQEVLERVEFLQTKYNATITVQPNMPAVIGYSGWVVEVWVNYVSNALKYGGRPPIIELGADEPQQGMVQFWVRDNGVGLAPDQQAQLFSEFTRFDKMRVSGHGLGLSIVKRIVERLDGQVGVESEQGQGSKFWFSLPAAPIEHSAEASAD